MNCRTTAREVSFGQTCRFVIGGGACWPPAPCACAKTGKPIRRTNSRIAIPYALLRFIAAPRSLESKCTNSNYQVKKCPPERAGVEQLFLFGRLYGNVPEQELDLIQLTFVGVAR